MTSEVARHALYAQLEQVLGTEHADTLMTGLPMEQAGQLASKTDIDQLDKKFDRLEANFDAFAAKIRGEVREMHKLMYQQFRNYSITMVGAMTALTAIFSVVVGIIR